MAKRTAHSDRSPASVVAFGLVLLQLLSALHFALVPHGFAAGLGGLVHVHRAASTQLGSSAEVRATERTPLRPTLVAGRAACSPEACPLAFSGAAARPVSASLVCTLLYLPPAHELQARSYFFADRARALLTAPKTSPPQPV